MYIDELVEEGACDEGHEAREECEDRYVCCNLLRVL